MTPTQIARRSDALYADGTCGMTRRVLCDMVAQRESDLEDARSEFDKMDKWHSAELQAALAENTKLRELVRRLISHVEHPPCEGCGFEMNCDGEHVTQCDEWLFMIADARKLGVEVDG